MVASLIISYDRDMAGPAFCNLGEKWPKTPNTRVVLVLQHKAAIIPLVKDERPRKAKHKGKTVGRCRGLIAF